MAEQAAEWLVRLEDSGGTDEERTELASWLRASPAHVLEFLRARAVWEAMSGAALKQLPDEAALLRELASAETSNVTTMAAPSYRTAGSASAETAHRSSRRRWIPAAAAALIALVAAAMFWMPQLLDPSRAVYETATGEQSTHHLADGSTIVLNTRSLVRLHFTPRYRDVYLDRGEALFEVAHDPGRPFRVWTGGTMVRAVGTRFNVYREEGTVTVTVLEGRVEATSGVTPEQTDVPKSTPLKHVQIGAGERARMRTATPIQTEQLAHPERTVDWQTRRLVFEQTPLADVIGEFNRYSEVPLRLEDPALAAKRINGVFDATDRASLVRFLQEFEDVDIEARKDAVLVKERRH
jgi:transmembrane sensor